jgi:CheY-like chemotaxis protein
MAKPILHILIIDDNAICADIIARIFTTKRLDEIATFHITKLHSAEDALHDLENMRYDIIFTDIEMTGMSGDDMVRIIRSNSGDIIHSGNRDISIFAITSKFDGKSRIRYSEAGITKCLKKPPRRIPFLIS